METSTEMIVLTVIEVGLERNIVYIMLERIMVWLITIQRLNNATESQQLSPDKLVAIRLILASSEKFDNMDHLISEGIEYVKNQEVESLTDENSSSQNDVNYVNHELMAFVKDEKDSFEVKLLSFTSKL